MAIPRSYMFCGERLATAIGYIALWNSAPKWDSCEPVQNMLNVLVTFLNNSGWRVWPQNHLTDVSLAQSSRRNSLMDPKMVWTIANWWGFQFLVISKMERVWIMITVKMVDKRGEPHAVPSSRGSLNPMVCPADFQNFWAIRRPLWLSSIAGLACQAVNQRPCHTRESVVPGELAGQLSRQELNNHAYGLMVYQCLQVYHPLMVKLGLVDPIILPTFKWFHHNWAWHEVDSLCICDEFKYGWCGPCSWATFKRWVTSSTHDQFILGSRVLLGCLQSWTFTQIVYMYV